MSPADGASHSPRIAGTGPAAGIPKAIRGVQPPIITLIVTALVTYIEQAGIYFKHKGKKPLTAAEQIRKSVTGILRREQREQQPRGAQDMGR